MGTLLNALATVQNAAILLRMRAFKRLNDNYRLNDSVNERGGDYKNVFSILFFPHGFLSQPFYAMHLCVMSIVF